MSLRIIKLNTWPPAQIQQNTLYLVKTEQETTFTAYLTLENSTEYKRLPTFEEMKSGVIYFGSTLPAIDIEESLWYNSTEATLYVKYNDGVSVSWIEAVPSVRVPDFGGNGQESTMSRSDHEHIDHLKYNEFQW